ncbi:MAG: peptidoglycan-binding protein, partial [Firmicutes bacterium]|nr:peptidoglycan-binding protein [Bacillota bacterium]
TGSLASTLGTIQPFRYRSYVYDPETGLYYLRSRYYNPVYSRFVCADYILENNVYAYCNNNPIVNIDSHGTSSEPFHAPDNSYHIEFAKDGLVLFSDINLINFVSDQTEVGNVVYVKRTNHVDINEVYVQCKNTENGTYSWRKGYAKADHSCKLLSNAIFPNVTDHINKGNKSQTKKLQNYLVVVGDMLGLDDLMYKPDGEYGPKTEEAVKIFQEYAGLPQDGLAGPNTLRALSLVLLQHDERYKDIEFQKIDPRNYMIN